MNVKRKRPTPACAAPCSSTKALLLILCVVSITFCTVSIVIQHHNTSLHQMMVLLQLEESSTHFNSDVWRQSQQSRRQHPSRISQMNNRKSKDKRLRQKDTVDRQRRQQQVSLFKTPVPDFARKRFWMKFDPNHKLYEPVARAFHSRGWSLTRQQEQAHVVWRDQPTKPRGIYSRLQPWQRYNQLPHTDAWDDKDAMAQRMEEYYQETQTKPLHSFPESYVLHQPQALRRFQQRLENGGIDIPWVLKQPTVNMGKGVTILGPQSDELKSVVQNVQKQLDEHYKGDEASEDSPRLVIQQYICNEMTYQGRKFDFRVFWMVASVDPLIVLYHTQHNYVRIGHALYDESNFASTKSHLTTHTFGAEEGKLTWSQFRDFVQEQYDDSLKPQLLQLLRKNNHNFNIPNLLHPSHANPFRHVEDQIKTILSHIVDAYKDITFHAHPAEMTSENAFTLHAADMILDNNLDVFLIEGTDGPGKDEDYDFRIDMHNSIFGEMVDVFEYVVDKQESGSMIDVEDMTQKGILGGYDVIYNQRSEADQGWMFDYRFERLPQKGCGAHGNDDSAESKSTSTASEAAVATMSKTFYMPGRVYSDGEPVTRSFRRWGYKPVDNVEDAQIVYNRVEHKQLSAKNLRPYQFISPFPNEEVFFDDDNVAQYLDRTRSNGVVCDPLLYNGIDGRRFQIVVYWLVLSTDPLLALYHDGFLHFPYDPKDEDEFVSYEHGQPPVWRGSWSSFERQLSENIINRENAMDHVRSQMRLALVSISRAFGNHAKQYQRKHDIPQRHYALFAAEFEVDRNLNVFLTDLHDELMAGEEHQYVVDLHDELYGTMLGMLEAVNSTTMDDRIRYSVESWISTLEILTQDKLSGFEWLARPATTGRNKQWSFQYDNTEGSAKECKSKFERPDITADAINWEKQKGENRD